MKMRSAVLASGGVIAALVMMPAGVFAAPAGLVDGLWFSTETITDHAPTTVYTVVRNQGDETLTGIVTLFVDAEAVRAEEVRVGAGDIKRIGVTHTFDAGEARVRLTLTAVEGADLDRTALGEEVIRVRVDTDGDGVPDVHDTDDDNDGIADADDPDPLVVNEQPEQSLSDRARSVLAQLRGDGGATSTKRAEGGDEHDGVGAATTSIPMVSTLEEARKRGAVAVRAYEQEHRDALMAIEEREHAQSSAEGFEPPLSEQSDKREHQIAAAGAAVTGTILEEGWMFYAHILVLVLGVLHLMWVFVKTKLLTLREEEEEF